MIKLIGLPEIKQRDLEWIFEDMGMAENVMVSGNQSSSITIEFVGGDFQEIYTGSSLDELVQEIANAWNSHMDAEPFFFWGMFAASKIKADSLVRVNPASCY